MDTSLPPVDEADAEAVLRQAILSVRVALDVLEEAVLNVATLDVNVTDTQVSKAITRLRDSFQVLNRERQKFAGELLGRGGLEPLDTGAARDEVGRLLDRLRAAGSAGSISGEPHP